ncbi:hypothetical protein UR09_05395 [Candidatus Nitromaritima sp. SCGC AAA799-A02]|nr:hypothetical protein UR09_05395 [Candidatus Nitromaritima sp. SCGC AAA799-A02]KMP11505.1 hypothetical protein UZ36_04200 [Candidatus Nitromaritima sp. SCGC AAA799-C22]
MILKTKVGFFIILTFLAVSFMGFAESGKFKACDRFPYQRVRRRALKMLQAVSTSKHWSKKPVEKQSKFNGFD